jgi:hypothetical protein
METPGDSLADGRSGRGILAWGLLLIGVSFWFFCLHAAWGTALQWELTAVAIIIGCVPRLRGTIARWLDRIRTPSRAQRFRAAVVISILATVLFLVLAYVQDWDFILRYQDEHSYAIQVQMMARGHLWMPAISPEVADFFTSFAIFTTPAYGSMYFPGTALMYAPTIWLHLPFWTLPVIAAGACVGLTYRLIAECIDGVAGLLAALMMTSLPAFRSLSLMLLSQTPMLLLGLLLVWAWLRWRAQRRAAWGLAIGAFAAWAMVTRPLDALAYIVPVGAAMILDCVGARASRWADRRIGNDKIFEDLGIRASTEPSGSAAGPPPEGAIPQKLETRPAAEPLGSVLARVTEPVSDPMRGALSEQPQPSLRNIALTIAFILLAASPFLAVEALQDRGMTGHWLESPNHAYAAANYPAPVVGFHTIDWKRAPVPKLAQDRELIQNSFWPEYRNYRLVDVPMAWWKERIPQTAQWTLPNPLLAALIPVGILGLFDRRRRVLAAIALLFLLLYALSVSYQQHYLMVDVPGVLFLALLGLEQIRRCWPRQSVMLVLIVAAMSVGAMFQTDTINWSPWMDLVRIENKLATLPPDPAIVLFRYHPFNPAVNIAYHEPVYNTDVAWPDDARMIRAHDLGAENIRLLQYYARTQPDRVVYLYDRDGDTVTRLGTPAKAARAYDELMRSTHGRQR